MNLDRCASSHHPRSVGLVLALGAFGFQPAATAQSAVDLDSARSFAVLAGAGITVTGTTEIIGDIGPFPTSSVTGFENVTLNGINHAGDLTTQGAKLDLLSAYNHAAGQAATTSYGPAFDLGGYTLLSGVYNTASSFGLTGTVTLDAMGDADAIWIFQAGSTLITASDSMVSLIGGAQASNIFWQVGSSATLGTGTDFAGSILAMDSITLNTDAMVNGGVYAMNGAVTMDSNSVSAVPEPGSALLFGVGVVLAWRRKRCPEVSVG